MTRSRTQQPRNLKILCDYARMLAAPFLTPHLNPGLSVDAAPVLSWLVARGAIMAPGWALCSRDTGQSLPAFTGEARSK